jgi:hypothetical protein
MIAALIERAAQQSLTAAGEENDGFVVVDGDAVASYSDSDRP